MAVICRKTRCGCRCSAGSGHAILVIQTMQIRGLRSGCCLIVVEMGTTHFGSLSECQHIELVHDRTKHISNRVCVGFKRRGSKVWSSARCRRD